MCCLQTSDSDQRLGDSERVQREHKPETSASESGMSSITSESGMLLLSDDTIIIILVSSSSLVSSSFYYI